MCFGKRSLVLVGLVLFLGATLASAYVGLTPKWTRKYYEAGTNLRSACTFGSGGGYMVAGGSDNSGNPKAIKTIDSRLNFTTLPGHEREAFSLYGVSRRMVGTSQGDRIGWSWRRGLLPRARGREV